MNIKIFESIKKQGFLPLFFHPNPNISIQVIKTLYDAGLRTVEYTHRGAQALNNFKQIIAAKNQHFPEMIIGIGTIKNSTEAENYLIAGADFLVSPCFSNRIAELVQKRNATWIPGCMTPTEINTAIEENITFIKLFPGNVLQPTYMSAIKEVFNGIDFIVTGGVELDEKNIKNWFDAGVSAVGLGSKLLKNQLMDDENFDLIKELTYEAINIIKSIKPR